MIKEIVATGADANAAIESGALLLGLPRDEVQFEIIDLPRKGGFLGLKKLPAKVRVWAELPDEKPARSEKPRRQEAPRKENKPPKAERAEKPARPEKPVKTEKSEKSEKPRAIEEDKAAPVEIEPTDEVRAKVEKAAAYVSEILKAMGLTDCDVLAPGKQADLIVIDLQRPNMQPVHNAARNLVYSGSKENVRLTMVAGRVLYENGAFFIGEPAQDIYRAVDAAFSAMRARL